MSSQRLSVKIFGIVAIIVLILTALAPIFYAFAPQYVPAPSTTSESAVESVVTE